MRINSRAFSCESADPQPHVSLPKMLFRRENMPLTNGDFAGTCRAFGGAPYAASGLHSYWLRG
jgi:hypothetical protein